MEQLHLGLRYAFERSGKAQALFLWKVDNLIGFIDVALTGSNRRHTDDDATRSHVALGQSQPQPTPLYPHARTHAFNTLPYLWICSGYSRASRP
jgi:hypothetical protein